MKDSLPSKLLKEKLPRFLQKCAQTFESDRRYRNDMRYLRIWLHLVTLLIYPFALLNYFCYITFVSRLKCYKQPISFDS